MILILHFSCDQEPRCPPSSRSPRQKRRTSRSLAICFFAQSFRSRSIGCFGRIGRMELPKEAVHDSCSGRIQNPNMLDLKATDNQTGQMVKHICLTKKENKDQPEADASARVPAEVDGATPVESQNPPAGTSADVLPGVAKACQEVASGLDFPENYGEIPNTTEDRTSAYCKRSRFYRRGPAILREKRWIPAFTTWLRGSQSGRDTVLCCLGACGAILLRQIRLQGGGPRRYGSQCLGSSSLGFRCIPTDRYGLAA
jgi:hypothetical protein